MEGNRTPCSEDQTTDICTITWDQLYKLLNDTVDLFQEYRDRYGYDEDQAKKHALLAALEGLETACALYSFALD